MRDRRSHLLLRDAVGLGVGDMELQRAVGDALSHERNHGDEAAGAEVQVLVVPVLAEQYVVVEVRELGGEIAQLVVSCGLHDSIFQPAPSVCVTT